MWIKACAILHNLLIDDPYDDSWEEPEINDNNEDPNTFQEEQQQPLTQKRETIKQIVLNFNTAN